MASGRTAEVPSHDWLAALNRRFQGDTLSSGLHSAGVLVHQLDYTAKRHGLPWEPCGPTDRCARTADRFSTTLLNAAAPHVFSATMPGFVLDASAVRVLCAWAIDANSADRLCIRTAGGPVSPSGSDYEGGCVPGCSGRGSAGRVVGGPPRWCRREACLASRQLGSCWCPWPAEGIGDMLRQQQALRPLVERRYRGSMRFNEVVVDAAVWVRNLPRTIEAVFVPAAAPPRRLEEARALQRAFSARYNGTPPRPVLWLNTSHARAPFRWA